MSQKSGPARRTGPHRFTEKQGQYLDFIYVYARMFHQTVVDDLASFGLAEGA